MLLVDTNIWLAAADRRSTSHSDCARLVLAHRGELASTVPVIAETAWLILDRLGTKPQAEFLRMVTSDRLEAIELTGGDWSRCVGLDRVAPVTRSRNGLQSPSQVGS